MDDETRFLIIQVTEIKTSQSLHHYSQMVEFVGTRLNVLISAGESNFYTAFNRELYKALHRTTHINLMRLQGGHDNNKMEWIKGVIMYRKKPRDLKIAFFPKDYIHF